MRHQSGPFICNLIFMIFGLRRFRSLSRGLMRFHNTTTHRFGILLTLSWCSCLLHGMVEAKSLSDFLSRVFFLENFSVLFVIWIDKLNSSNFSSIVELQFLLSIPVSRVSSTFRPNFWICMIWSGSRLHLCQSPLRAHVSFRRLVFNIVNFKKSSPRVK